MAVESNEISVEFLSELLVAIDRTNTRRAMAKAIAETLGRYVDITCLALGTPESRAVVVRTAAGWRLTDSAGDRSLRTIVPGLAIATRGYLPAWFEQRAFARALGRVISMALNHLEVVHRLAEVSRAAHVRGRDLRARVAQLEQPIVIARSAAMRDVIARADLVAQHATTVLITGESGTGKEVLARHIHRMSPRARGPLVQLDCGAIAEGLIESELFGHERGAFTGAEQTHVGAFERAHGGTLVLDEIGELPLGAQAKLLRVVQERQLRRVGGRETINVDVRLIAATNRSLVAMVRAGAFREDLFYRIHVFSLDVPALRDRREDIAPLAHALVKQLGARLSLPAPTIPRAVLAELERYRWPGNVRELANVLETAMIMGGGKRLELPATFRNDSVADDASLNSAVRQTIAATLRATRGKIYGRDGAAERLGLKPQTLQSKMRKLGIARSAFTG